MWAESTQVLIWKNMYKWRMATLLSLGPPNHSLLVNQMYHLNYIRFLQEEVILKIGLRKKI